jgi:hypothetical protein
MPPAEKGFVLVPSLVTVGPWSFETGPGPPRPTGWTVYVIGAA